MKTAQNNSCVECGSPMEWATRSDSVQYKGHSQSFVATAWWCTGCDEATFGAEALEASEQALADLRALVDRVLSPVEVARIRELLGLSQREAGRILGGGVRAFQKYECGTLAVSEAMTNLLILLGNDPTRLEELRVACPSRGGRVVQVKRLFSSEANQLSVEAQLNRLGQVDVTFTSWKQTNHATARECVDVHRRGKLRAALEPFDEAIGQQIYELVG